VLIIILILIADSFAQNSNSTAAPAPDFPPSYYDVVALFLIAIIITGFIAIVYYEGRKEVVRVKKTVSAFARFRQYITRSAPIEKEADIMLDHDFDGIRELDNRVPPWFSWLFYVTIIFAVIYLLNYHVFQASPLQDEEYQMQVKKPKRKEQR
jgi:cytochrome c oxidase cbb3-type subunit 3